MLRGFAEQLRPYQDSIPKCVLQLLLSCPHECAAIRKVCTASSTILQIIVVLMTILSFTI